MDQIEEIKAKTDIVSLLSEYLPLKKAGRNFRCLCPFHNEKTPSFMVSPELQIFKCFGCGASGDAIKFLQLYERMDFWEAVEFLAKRAGIKLVRRRLGKDEQIKKRLYEINHLTAEFYHFLLIKHEIGKRALNYLVKRGIKKEIIEQFRLGFSPLEPESVAKFLLKKGYSVAEILQTGLIVPTRRGQYWDRFRSRLVFPLYNHRGNIIGFSGRTIPGISPVEAAKYINTPETIIYHKRQTLYGLWLTKQDIRKKNEAVVVEGEFDLISSYQAGVKNVVAIKGTAFTEEQAKLIRRFAEKAILTLDADFAGNEAAKRSIQVADSIGLDIKIASLPVGFKDPDELAQKDAILLKKTLDRAVLVWDFIIDNSLKKYSATTALGKKKILVEVLPFLAKIDNEVVKNHYLQKLASDLGANLEAVLIELEKLKNKSVKLPSFQDSLPEKEQGRRYLLEKYLLALIFTHHQWKYLSDASWHNWIITPPFKRVVKLGKKFLNRKKTLNVNKFLAFLPEELKTGFADVYLFLEKTSIKDIDGELERSIKSLETMELRRRLTELAGKIAQKEKEKRGRQLKRAEKEFIRLSQRLTELETA